MTAQSQLILVEGIPGSGKTTMAEFVDRWLERNGLRSRLYTEGNLDHPADYKEHAWFTQAESHDCGRTWTPARRSTIRHNHGTRPRIDRLAGGALVVSYAERRRHRVLAVPSFDGGRTWLPERRVTLLDSPRHAPTPDFSYPALARAADDTYLFVYYAYPEPDSPHRGIYGSFVPADAFAP